MKWSLAMLQNSPEEKKHGSSLIRVTQKPQTQRGCIAFHFCCSARAARDKSALLYCHCVSFSSGVFFSVGRCGTPYTCRKRISRASATLIGIKFGTQRDSKHIMFTVRGTGRWGAGSCHSALLYYHIDCFRSSSGIPTACLTDNRSHLLRIILGEWIWWAL